jgi:xanthine/uracil permease
VKRALLALFGLAIGIYLERVFHGDQRFMAFILGVGVGTLITAIVVMWDLGRWRRV